jgi:hypothetical protein
LPNERIDLPEGKRHGRVPFEITAQKAIRRDLQFQRRLGGVIGGGRAVFLGQRQDAEDAPDAGGTIVLVDLGADVWRCAPA